MTEGTLNDQQRIEAVYDLLKYCRNPGHQVTVGLRLGRALEVQTAPDGRDDARLALALEQVVTSERELLRRNMGVPQHDQEEQPTVEEIFREDQATKNTKLELLSLIWAYYFHNIPLETLAGIYGRVTKTVENKLERGRREVADLIVRREDGLLPAGRSASAPLQPEPKRPEVVEVDLLTKNDRASRHHRAIMLERVRKFWITDALEHSLHQSILLQINMHYAPQAVAHPWDALVQRPDQAAQPLPNGTSIINVYDEAVGELLILGEPGTGKTTALLELTRDLLARAEQVLEFPMPVIFNLASWANQRLPLANWLIDELKIRYAIPHKIAQDWIDSLQVLPLLDGLDEVIPEYRAACVDAINTFRGEQGALSLVVCCRTSDYLKLHVRLELRAAIELRPMTLAQIDNYLVQLGTSTAPLRSALHNSAGLQELAQTPLFLHVLISTYAEHAPEALADLDSIEINPQRLFDAYVDRALKRRGPASQYRLEQTIRSLEWLAYTMEQKSQRILLIEWMQPNWLPTAAERQRYMRLVGLARGVIVGGAVGVLGAVIIMMLPVVVGWPYNIIEVTPTTVLISELVGGGVFALFLGIVGLRASRNKKEPIHPVETLSWPEKTTRKALAVGLGFTLINVLIFSWVYGIASGLTYGLGTGIPLGLLILAADMIGGEIEAEEKTSPNQGIKRSGYNALRVGLGLGLPVGAPMGLIPAFSNDFSFLLVFALPTGLAMSVMMALFFGGGAFLKHMLLRRMLNHANLIPKDYAHFLDYASERILLRKVGNGYMFVHPLIASYFAERYTGPDV
jgi:DNA polymerase III delta prime subunit